MNIAKAIVAVSIGMLSSTKANSSWRVSVLDEVNSSMDVTKIATVKTTSRIKIAALRVTVREITRFFAYRVSRMNAARQTATFTRKPTSISSGSFGLSKSYRKNAISTK